MTDEITCFKAYDVRGQVPAQLNSDIAYRIGRAYVEFLKPRQVVVGYDIRLSSQDLCDALTQGLLESGADVINIGQCGTEEVYFAVSHLHADGGIVVTASHNPADYNGMKFVRESSKPISGDTGLNDIKRLAEQNSFAHCEKLGAVSFEDIQPAYIAQLLSYVDVANLRPLKIICNAGNGAAGPTIDAIEQFLPFQFSKLHHEADGNFPNGVPNPLLEENRGATTDAIQQQGADLGIAWDGDFDRCFFFDENGRFIEGYYMVGLLAQSFLELEPNGKIVHDPRLIWDTQEITKKFAGEAIQCKVGHAFIKEKMREEDAVYGGEMSAHHYFRDFFYCDSGMIPWLLVAGLMSSTGKKLSELVAPGMRAFPVSGEINRQVENPGALLQKIESSYTASSTGIDYTDGLSMNFENWRFNIRLSNTEPLVRLNVESRGDETLMQEKTAELLRFISQAKFATSSPNL